MKIDIDRSIDILIKMKLHTCNFYIYYITVKKFLLHISLNKCPKGLPGKLTSSSAAPAYIHLNSVT